MKKRVLFLITKATWGGAQRYVYDLATHLPKTEFDITVAYGERGRLTEMLEKEHIEGHQISSLGRDVAIMSDVSSFFKILIYLWRTKPDVVHLNSSKAAALGALAARLARIPKIVFTVHGWPFNEKRNEFARIAIYIASWFSGLLSHVVVVVSKSDEGQGKKMPLVGKKIRYIPIGIEATLFLTREEAVTSLSISAPTPRIVTIAELTANKGIQYAIEAIARLKERGVEVSYFLISDGEERKALEYLARELGVADQIHFLGFVSEAAKYLNAFDIFLLPSIKEGMPYVLLEAAEAGLPIITTNVVNPEIMERYENVRAVPPGRPKAIVEAIQKTLDAQGVRTSTQKTYFPLLRMIEATARLYH